MKNIVTLRETLVKEVEKVHSKINLYGGLIVYIHENVKMPNEMGKDVEPLASANKFSGIKIYKKAMDQPLEVFLNTVRHEGYHIAQFNATFPDLGNSIANNCLKEFLAEFREIVGGFNENLKFYNDDVNRFTSTYHQLQPIHFQGNNDWYERIVKTGENTANAIQSRITTEKRKFLNHKEKTFLKSINNNLRRINRRNNLFRRYQTLLVPE